MLAWELERVETGDSTVGEKYELAAASSAGDIEGGTFVCNVREGPWPFSRTGNLGGGALP